MRPKSSKNTNNGKYDEIVRERHFSNHSNRKDPYGKKPMYFVNTSNGKIASNPNSLKDLGGVRNCEYTYEDPTDDVKRATWAELLTRGAQRDENAKKSNRN